MTRPPASGSLTHVTRRRALTRPPIPLTYPPDRPGALLRSWSGSRSGDNQGGRNLGRPSSLIAAAAMKAWLRLILLVLLDILCFPLTHKTRFRP